MKKHFLLLLVGLTLVGCKEDGPRLTEINPHQVGEYTFYIPKRYVTSASDDSDSILLESYYPGGAPVLRTWQELKDQGNVHKTITILMTDLNRYENYTPDKGLSELIKLFKATEDLGREYGLTHQGQPKNVENEWGEIWIESSERDTASFVTCKTKSKVPHCRHRFHGDHFEYQITFDKRLLPEWQSIRKNVLALIDSFNSEETAYTYYKQQFLNVYNEQMEGTR